MSGDAAAPVGAAAAAAGPAASAPPATRRSLAWTNPLELAAALPRAAPQQIAAAAEAAAEKAGEKLAAVQERGMGIATRAWNAVSGNGPEALRDVGQRQETALCSPDDLHLPAVEVSARAQRVACRGARCRGAPPRWDAVAAR